MFNRNQRDHKTILIHGSDRQFVENLAQTIKKGPHPANFTVINVWTHEELNETLESRIDIDLLLIEIDFDFFDRSNDTESPEMDAFKKIRDTQQKHTRIVVYTQSEDIVTIQHGDFAREIPMGDRFIKGHGEGHIPGRENDFQRKIRDWLGAL